MTLECNTWHAESMEGYAQMDDLMHIDTLRAFIERRYDEKVQKFRDFHGRNPNVFEENNMWDEITKELEGADRTDGSENSTSRVLSSQGTTFDGADTGKS